MRERVVVAAFVTVLFASQVVAQPSDPMAIATALSQAFAQAADLDLTWRPEES